jgi:hypothetical protein
VARLTRLSITGYYVQVNYTREVGRMPLKWWAGLLVFILLLGLYLYVTVAR